MRLRSIIPRFVIAIDQQLLISLDVLKTLLKFPKTLNLQRYCHAEAKDGNHVSVLFSKNTRDVLTDRYLKLELPIIIPNPGKYHCYCFATFVSQISNNGPETATGFGALTCSFAKHKGNRTVPAPHLCLLHAW